MMVSRLLKSCATPPVSWPTASSLWLCRRASSAFCKASACSLSGWMSRPTALMRPSPGRAAQAIQR